MATQRLTIATVAGQSAVAVAAHFDRLRSAPDLECQRSTHSVKYTKGKTWACPRIDAQSRSTPLDRARWTAGSSRPPA